MDREFATRITKCPKCSNTISIKNVWYPGGVNDYGYFTLKCKKCGHVFEVYVGRDVDASSVEEGAILVSKRDKD